MLIHTPDPAGERRVKLTLRARAQRLPVSVHKHHFVYYSNLMTPKQSGLWNALTFTFQSTGCHER